MIIFSNFKSLRRAISMIVLFFENEKRAHAIYIINFIKISRNRPNNRYFKIRILYSKNPFPRINY